MIWSNDSLSSVAIYLVGNYSADKLSIRRQDRESDVCVIPDQAAGPDIVQVAECLGLHERHNQRRAGHKKQTYSIYLVNSPLPRVTVPVCIHVYTAHHDPMIHFTLMPIFLKTMTFMISVLRSYLSLIQRAGPHAHAAFGLTRTDIPNGVWLTRQFCPAT